VERGGPGGGLYTYVDRADIDEIIEEHLQGAGWSNACLI